MTETNGEVVRFERPCASCKRAHMQVWRRLAQPLKVSGQQMAYVGKCRYTGQKVYRFTEPEKGNAA